MQWSVSFFEAFVKCQCSARRKDSVVNSRFVEDFLVAPMACVARDSFGVHVLPRCEGVAMGSG